MKTLVLSNYLSGDFPPGLVCVKWEQSHPAVADFQCAVLDMKLDRNVAPAPPRISYAGYPFYGLSDDVIRLLRAGGVVVCLNYYTFLNTGSKFDDRSSRVHMAIFSKRREDFSYEYKWTGLEETSYDWLDLGLLQRTEVDRLSAMPGQQLKVISTVQVVSDYFSHVREYHKVINGISRGTGSQRGYLEWRFRGDPAYTICPPTMDEVEVLAVTEVTDDPIAVAMKYRGFPGTLVFLPTYDLPKVGEPGVEEISRSISQKLSFLGEYYYEVNRRELGVKLEPAPWLLEHRTRQAIAADKELEDLEKRKTAAQAKRDKYDRMLALINGYGKPLEKAVGGLFGKEWLGFDVEETEPGYPIDLFVRHPETGQALALQMTGVVGKLTQRDKHFGALMGYRLNTRRKTLAAELKGWFSSSIRTVIALWQIGRIRRTSVRRCRT